MVTRFSTLFNRVITMSFTFRNGRVVGAKGAKTTLSGAIESGDVGISKVVSAGLSTGFEAFISVGISDG